LHISEEVIQLLSDDVGENKELLAESFAKAE